MDKKAGPPRPKEEVAKLLIEWEQSNLSKKDFCNQNNINYQTFIGWIVQRRNQNQPIEKKFIPIQVEARNSNVFAEIHLTSTKKIILYQSVSVEMIKTILRC